MKTVTIAFLVNKSNNDKVNEVTEKIFSYI